MGTATVPQRKTGRRRIATLVGVGSILIGITLSLLPTDLERRWGLPLLYGLRGDRSPPDDIVVVAMEQGTARKLGLTPAYSRWPRSLHAKVVSNLSRAGARLLVYDVEFSDRNRQSAADDHELAAAIRAAGNVVIAGSIADQGDALLPEGHKPGIAVLKPRDTSSEDAPTVRQCRVPASLITDAALGVGPFVVPPQSERIDLFWTYNAQPCSMPTLPAVALQADSRSAWPVLVDLAASIDPSAAGRFAGLPAIGGETMDAMRAGFTRDPSMRDALLARVDEAQTGRRISDADARRVRALVDLYDGPETRYLNLYGPALSLPTISMADVIDADRDAARWDAFSSRIRGKVVFIGASELSIEDQKNSMDAFDTVYIDRVGLRLQGVEIAATAFSNLAHGTDLRRSGVPLRLGILVGFGLWLAAVWSLLRPAVAMTLAGAGLVTYLSMALLRFSNGNHWDPVIAPMAMTIAGVGLAALARYAALVRERRTMLRALQPRLPKTIGRQFLLSGHVNLSLPGVCLMSDLSNWTRLVGQHPQATLSDIMQGYLDRLFESVEAHRGFPVDAAGDGLFAIWVDQQATPLELRRRACVTALEIVTRGAAVAAMRSAKVATRVGLSSGELTLRDIGGRSQFQLKAFGLTVNLTSRIEGLNKWLGTRVLASSDMIDGLEEFLWRPLGRFHVDGIDAPIDIAELIARRVEVAPGMLAVCDLFAAGMAACRQGNHSTAAQMFAKVLQINPDDGPAQFYLDWLQRHGDGAWGVDGLDPIRIGKLGVVAPPVARVAAD